MSLTDRIYNGERAAIAKAITLVESKNQSDKLEGKKLISELMVKPGHSIRLGFSGPPGVGKSTFIESFGKYLVSKGLKLGVLAIDPSSQITGGSILGDKTRMIEISKSENTFIRSTPSKGSLGGVSSGTREAAIILDAAGYDYVFIETVGVGQSEILASNLVDIFTLIVGPGSGDELQGIKKGITEYADIFIVNKNDGDLKIEASKTQSDYKSAVSYYRNDDINSPLKDVLLVSSLEQTGMDEVIQAIDKIIAYNKEKNEFDKRRFNQLSFWLEEQVKALMQESLEKKLKEEIAVSDLTSQVVEGKIHMYEAIDQIMTKVEKKI